MIESNKTDEISLKELFFRGMRVSQYIFKKWKLILLFSSLGAIIGFTYSLFIDSIYKAEYKFVLKENRPITLNGAFSSSLGFDLNMKDDSFIYSNDNFIDLFKSKKIIEKSLLQTIIYNKEEITLADYYLKIYDLNNNFLTKTQNKIFPVKSVRKDFNRYQVKILNLIYKHIVDENIIIEKQDKNKAVFIATISSVKEGFSINFIESIFKVILEDYKTLKTTSVKKLEDHIDSLKFKTNSLLKNNQNSKMDPISSNVNLFDSNNLNIEYDLNMRILFKLSEQLEISKLNLLNNSQLIQMIDNSSSPLLDQKVSGLFLMTLFGIIFGIIAIILILLSKTITEFKLQM